MSNERCPYSQLKVNCPLQSNVSNSQECGLDSSQLCAEAYSHKIWNTVHGRKQEKHSGEEVAGHAGSDISDIYEKTRYGKDEG
jgi:hypothetical protein